VSHRFGRAARLAAPFALAAALGAAPGARAQSVDEHLLEGVKARAIGPTAPGGRIVDVAVPSKAPWRIYAASASGGVWRSDNNGTTWSCIFDRALSNGALALFDGDPDVLWVATGEGNNQRSSYAGNGVWRTLDGGKTWSHVGLEETHHLARIVTDPAGKDRDLAWVAAMGHLYTKNGERGLYRTRDGGANWERVLSIADDVGVTDVAADPRADGVLYAATYQRTRRPWNFDDVGDAAIYRSSDGGDSWRRLAGGLPSGKLGRIGLGISKSDPDVVYACIDNQNLPPEETKTDGAEGGDGAKSDAKSDDAKADAKGDAKKADAAKPRRRAPIGGEVWRSNDAGKTWEKRNPKPVSGEPPYYYGQVHVDPRRVDRLWLLGIVVYVSDDGGATWSEGKIAGSLHSDHHALYIDPERPGRVILGNDGGLAQSYDDGANWDWYNNLPVAQFYTVSLDERRPYRVYGGLQDNGIWTGPSRSRSPGGATAREWNFIGGGDGMYVLADPTDPDTVFLEAQFGSLQRTDLRTWESTSIAPQPPDANTRLRFNWCSPLLLSAHNPRIVYFGSQFLWKSLDRGAHWKAISPDLTTNDPEKVKGNVPHCTLTTISESPLDPDSLLVGTDDGNVQWSKDGGKSWTEVGGRMPGLPSRDGARRWVSRVELSSHDPKSAWVTFTGYREDDFAAYVYRTRDGGETFEAVTDGLPAAPVNVVRESPRAKDVLFLGGDGGAFFSIDGGDHWQRLASGLPTVSVLDLAVHRREREVVLATHGRGLFVVDVTALEQLSADRLAADACLFAPGEAVNWRGFFGIGDVFGGDRRWRAPNPEQGAPLWYWLREKSEAAPRLEIVDDGKVVRTLELENGPGVHPIVWDLRPDPPKKDDGEKKPKKKPLEDATAPDAIPAGEPAESVEPADDASSAGTADSDEEREAEEPEGALTELERELEHELEPFAQDAGGRRRGFNGVSPLPPGRYVVRLVVGAKTFEQPLVLRADPVTESADR
jgi:photosystem II stability/assembly factor-like uncharacterized protein